MRVGIVYKKEKVKNKVVIERLTENFRSRGCEVKPIFSGAELKDVDYAVVLGGDGALLHAALIAGQQHIKVVGLNFGTLGFLSEFEAAEALQVVDLICGEHAILSRSVLKITLNDKVFFALNETVLQRDYSRPYGNQVSEFSVQLNGQKIQNYVADGLAIATPTGSTAYSLSAGGSILAPNVNAFILTPICSMGMKNYPFVVADDGKITFELPNRAEDMKLYADGRPIGSVNNASRLLIEKASFTADFITRDKNGIFKAINNKFLK